MINPQPATIAFPRDVAGMQIAVELRVWPDPRAAPPNELGTSEIVIALANARAQVQQLSAQLAAVLILLADAERETESPEIGARVALARASVRELAAGCSIAAKPAALNDGGEPPSALDLLGAEDGPAPAPTAIGGATNDGSD